MSSFVAGTIFLWWTWWDVKNDIEESEKDFGTIPILDVDLSNETAFLVFSIIASIFTVSNLFKDIGEIYTAIPE